MGLFITLATKGLFITIVTKGFSLATRVFYFLTTMGFSLSYFNSITSNFLHPFRQLDSICLDTVLVVCVVEQF